MREKGAVVLVVMIVVLIAAVVAAAGYFFFFNPRAQIDRAVKPDTSLEDNSILPKAPRTEIKESGYNLEVIIEPSENNVISDTVTITATQVSEEAAGVGFFLSPDKESFIEGGQPSIGTDSSPEGGWSNMFNTTEHDNGNYYVNIVVWQEGGEGPPLGFAQIPVEIKN
jgi:hypothetical protein